MKNIKIFYPARCVAVALLLGIFAFNGSAQNDKKTPPSVEVVVATDRITVPTTATTRMIATNHSTTAVPARPFRNRISLTSLPR